MAKGGGGGGRGGRNGGLQLAPGYKYGGTLSASRTNLRVGDSIKTGGDKRSSGIEGVISKVSRTNMTVDVPYWGGRTLDISVPISTASGGVLARGKTVYRIN